MIIMNQQFFANLKDKVNDHLQANEGICKWFSIDEITHPEMPFTAKYVVEHYYSVGHLTGKLYVGVTTKECVDFLGLSES